jgi:hypothetical protein
MTEGASTTSHSDIRGLPKAEPQGGVSSGGDAVFARESGTLWPLSHQSPACSPDRASVHPPSPIPNVHSRLSSDHGASAADFVSDLPAHAAVHWGAAVFDTTAQMKPASSRVMAMTAF